MTIVGFPVEELWHEADYPVVWVDGWLREVIGFVWIDPDESKRGERTAAFVGEVQPNGSVRVIAHLIERGKRLIEVDVTGRA